MHDIIEKPLGPVKWNDPPTLDYYYDLYKVGVLLTDSLISYMTMRDWYVWEEPKQLLAAHEVKSAWEKKALKKIFGDLISDAWEDAI